jgi:uncharacterized SAM-binding protein YcdF (DUF218 family)
MTLRPGAGRARSHSWPIAVRWGRRALLGAALFVALWLGREGVLKHLARWLNVGEPPRACDYVLVLPGGEETRPFVAAAMVKAGLAREALVPTVVGSPDTEEGTQRPSHEIIRDVLERRGVPPQKIHLIAQASASTYMDAQALGQFLRARPPATIAVVTHDYHTRRARWVFRKALRGRADDIYFVAAPHDHFDENTWWYCREGLLAHFSELAKLVGYLVYYAGLSEWCSGLLIVAAIAAVLAVRRRVRPTTSAAKADNVSTTLDGSGTA